MGWWNKIWLDQAKNWVFGYLDASQVPDQLARIAIPPNTSYLSIYLRSFRIVNIRKGISKFYGTVHSFIALPHISGEKAKFHFLITPLDLSNIDAKNVDRIISMNHRLLGPFPYRGGDLEIELGLFSIKSADLAKPFLTVLEGMSQAAGVSYLSAALPFVGPLLQGVNLLAGADSDSILEIGLARSFTDIETGTMAVIRAPKEKIQTSDLHLDSEYKLIDKNEQPLTDYPYMIIAIEAHPTYPNWFSIPELAEADNNLRDELRRGKVEQVMEALTVFKRATLTSPDLLPKHAVEIAKSVEEEVNNVLKFFPTSKRELTIKPLNQFDPFSSKG